MTLFTDKDTYNQDANDLSERVRIFLLKEYTDLVQKGYHPREISFIIDDTNTFLRALTTLQKQNKIPA